MRREEATDLKLPNGVVVPAALRVNELELARKREQFEGAGYGRMTHAIARGIGFGEAEILDVLGPETDGTGAAPKLTGGV